MTPRHVAREMSQTPRAKTRLRHADRPDLDLPGTVAQGATRSLVAGGLAPRVTPVVLVVTGRGCACGLARRGDPVADAAPHLRLVTGIV
ncbi:MAG: hypothetical protein P3W94_002660 [Paracoccus sp. (in: a-proteobacteria)]|nr:hypothetical protein [Paracoccus sp. (in: a-proteobacteria)]